MADEANQQPTPQGGSPGDLVASRNGSAVYRFDGSRFGPGEKPRIAAHDFANPVYLAGADLRRMMAMHDEFVRMLSGRLSLFLRMEVVMKLKGQLTTLPFAKLVDSLKGPIHLCIFKAAPLSGAGILSFEPGLAFSLVERMLGGKGVSTQTSRSLTEIETSLVDDVAMIVLEEWCNPWKREQELRASIVGHESDGRFVQTSAPGTLMLTFSLEVVMGEFTGRVRLAVPFAMFEPLIKRQGERTQVPAEAAPVRRQEWSPAYGSIRVPLDAEWSAMELTLGEVAALKVGDVLALSNETLEQTSIKLSGSSIFTGRAGQEDGFLAVEITARSKTSAQQLFSHGR